MKQSLRSVTGKVYILFTLLLVQTLALAQETTEGSSSTVKVTKTETQNWYAEPWVWAVGAVLLILLLMLLFRGNRSATTSSGERVTVTKTVSRDSDAV